MRKKNFLLFAVLLLSFSNFFTACNKADHVRISESANEDQNKYSLMTAKRESLDDYTLVDMQRYSPSMQRDIFRLMSADKKAALWQERIDMAIGEEQDDIRIGKLKELKSLISASVYDANDKPRLQIADWIEANMVEIGYDRMKQIVTTLNPVNTTGIIRVNDPGLAPVSPKQDCECSQKSDWCMDDGYSSSGGLKCRAADCNTSSWGCGAFWSFACMGMCGV